MDMTVMAKSIVQGRWMLNDLVEIFTWARMKLKTGKSRSLVIKNGKPKNMIFKIDGNPIPTVEEKPIKCLGKWFTISSGQFRSMTFR